MLFLIVILIIAIFLYLVYTRPVKLEFRFSSGEMDLRLRASWLGFVKLRAERMNSRTHITVHIFGLKIYSGFIKKTGKGFNTDMIRVISLSNTELKTSYGLNEPHISGILFGALSAIGSVARIERFEQRTEFVTADEYFEMEGNSELNIGKTITNYLRLKTKERKRRKYHGSISFE